MLNIAKISNLFNPPMDIKLWDGGMYMQNRIDGIVVRGPRRPSVD